MASYLIIGALVFILVVDCLGDNYKKIKGKDKEIEELKKRIAELEKYFESRDDAY